MSILKNFLLTLLLLSLGALETSAVKRFTLDADGITVTTASGENTPPVRVRLTVAGQKIIGVSATPDAAFSSDRSLVTLPPSAKTPFKVKESGSTVSVMTDSVRASVNISTGDVRFYDCHGHLVAAETPGGRSFTPIEVEGTKGYTVCQRFESLDDDEGLYGLGQHQSDEFNYKGLSEELFQYNTKVSVPFVISTGNYGILWDSYSLCRFGDPEPYRQLGEVLRIRDAEGREGALTGTYIPRGASEPQIVRREDSIYFEHLVRPTLDRVVNLPVGFNCSGSHVIYEGDIEAPVSGTYHFQLYYSGYMSVSADGCETVPQRWRTAWNPNSYRFDLHLEAGKRVPLKIDWYPDGGVAYCGLRARAPRSREEEMCMCWWGEMQSQINYWFVYGHNMDDVIAGYRSLTGNAPVMPKWALGFWQSREKYENSGEVLSTLAEFRRRHVPIDNIVIDWMHWEQDAWGSHEFDRKRFPDPKGMVDSIHAMNGRVMVSVWPKFYASTEHFKEFDANGWMYRLPVTDSIRDWVGPGYIGSFYDAYHPEARRLFWKQIEDHYCPLGIDAWWMDASEPNVRDCTDMQYRKDLITPTALGPSTKYFNAYGLMNAEAIYDGQRGHDPDRRVFLLTRSGFAGQQRYSTATWSGDIASRWEDLKAQISAGLNFAASGIPYWTHDIGGFCVENRYVKAAKEEAKSGAESPDMKEWRELNTRWYQFGAFTPLYRAHGQFPRREIYNIAPSDHPAYRSILYYSRLRYALMPYIYSLAGHTCHEGYTIMRPLAMDFTDDKAVRPLGDQYMFGPAIMVAPVYTFGAVSRDMYFPGSDLWYDFYSGQTVTGWSHLTVDAPYDRIPLYVRSGSIIPFGPDIESTMDSDNAEIDLYVYTGRDGSFTLYEDEGVNYNYEKGLYATICLRWNDSSSTLTIGECRGGYDGMPPKRKFNIVKISPDKPSGFDRSNRGVSVSYTGNEIKCKL